MRGARIASVAFVLVVAGMQAAASVARQPAAPTVDVVSVRAFPVAAERGSSKGVLDPGNLNTVAVTNALAFRVVVHNSSAAKQKNVHVVLSISRSAAQGGPNVHQVTVGTIPAGKTRAVTFGRVGQIPFATRTTLTVSVPSGGKNLYPVIFTLPSGNSAPPTTTVPIKMPPKVIGLDQQAAIQKLEAGGFHVFIVTVYSTQPAGRVVGWRTGADIRMIGGPPGQVVVINVSNGKKHA